MSALTTFEDRLRSALDVSRSHGTEFGEVCAVFQQDVADALSLIAALRRTHDERTEAMLVLTALVAEVQQESDHA